jgi:hypothetical protein
MDGKELGLRGGRCSGAKVGAERNGEGRERQGLARRRGQARQKRRRRRMMMMMRRGGRGRNGKEEGERMKEKEATEMLCRYE